MARTLMTIAPLFLCVPLVVLLHGCGSASPTPSPAPSPAPCIEIASGVCMPFASDGDVMKHTPAINDTLSSARWLAAGGRGLDSAWSYDHGGYGHAQRQVGVAIKASGVPRKEMFVTTKIPCGSTEAEVATMIQYDLDQFMLPFVDLLLIHTPKAPFCNSSAQVALTWAAMQTALHKNQTRAIGVSNFVTETLTDLLKANTTKVVPAVNQISLSVGTVDKATVDFCKSKGVHVEAYSPLGHTGAPVLHMKAVLEVAKSVNKSAAAVALKYIVQSNHSFVTASGTTAHDADSLSLFDWNLSSAQMAALDAANASAQTLIV